MNADPHLGTPRPDGEPTGNGSFGSPGPQGPSDDPRSGSSSIHRSERRRRRSRISGPTFSEALSSGWGHALELGDYVRSMIGVRGDRAALQLRRKTTQAGIAAVAALGVGTVVISASLRLVVGLSEGLAQAFGRAWLGDLAAAVLLLGGLAGGTALYLSRWEKKELEKHLEKYERQHREHSARHGSHAGNPASSNPGGAARP